MCMVSGDSVLGTIEIDRLKYNILESSRVTIPQKVWEYKTKNDFIAKTGSQKSVFNYSFTLEENRLYLTKIEFSQWESRVSNWSKNLMQEIFGVDRLFIKEQNDEIKLLLDKEISFKETDEKKVRNIEMFLKVLTFKNGELISSCRKVENIRRRVLKDYIDA